jgi:hypothetical protein
MRPNSLNAKAKVVESQRIVFVIEAFHRGIEDFALRIQLEMTTDLWG